jgi:hypothetical protein
MLLGEFDFQMFDVVIWARQKIAGSVCSDVFAPGLAMASSRKCENSNDIHCLAI